jgi:hypothetical protein
MSRSVIRRRTALLVSAGLTVLAALTAGCGGTTAPQPSTSTTTTTTPSATEKQLQPGGGNLFTPTVKAPPAATVAPGQHPGINGVP